jgi:uroporphyrinogen-III synthase
MKVLLLRQRDAAASTARSLARLGHEAVLAPLIEIAAIDEGRLPHDRSKKPYGAVIAASANAFTSLHPRSRAALEGLPAMVVGARTASVAEGAGLSPLRPVFRTARELASALHGIAPPGRLLYLAGRDRRPEIEIALRRGTRAFVLVEVYAADLAPALPSAAETALRRGEIDAVLHYSARSAKAYVALAQAAALLPQALRPVQLCLSGAVAEPLIDAGARRVKLAASPDEAHLLALLPTPRRR